MAARKQTRDQAETSESVMCDNHPDREAVLSTTSNGAHAEIHFCEECIPEHWR